MTEPGSTGKPYRDIAVIYDELIGNTAFDFWRENFERLSKRFEIRYESAADIACGTGLAAAYLADYCQLVYAVDASSSMLEVARQNSIAPGVVFLQQRFTEIDLPASVDLLTCNFDSLNYVTSEPDLKETIRRFWCSINPGGYAVFDMNTSRELAYEWGDSVILHRVRDGLLIWEMSWDPLVCTNTLVMTNFIREQGDLYRMSGEVHRERSYELELVLGCIVQAGFRAVEVFDANGLGAVNEETRRVQFIARR